MRAPKLTLAPWQKALIYILSIFIIVSGSIAAFRFATRPTSPLPASVESQLPFSPLVVSKDEKKFTTSDYSLDTGEDGGKFLNYTIQSKDGYTIKVLQQEQPPAFIEIPEYKERVLTNKFKQYDTVQTSVGVVYLGRLAVPKDAQVGIVLEKGLLVFLTPSKELDKVQWRTVVNELKLLETN